MNNIKKTENLQESKTGVTKTRRVHITSSRTEYKRNFFIGEDIKTFGDLKAHPDFPNLPSNMSIVLGSNNHNLESNKALLPDTDISLFAIPTKHRGGAKTFDLDVDIANFIDGIGYNTIRKICSSNNIDATGKRIDMAQRLKLWASGNSTITNVEFSNDKIGYESIKETDKFNNTRPKKNEDLEKRYEEVLKKGLEILENSYKGWKGETYNIPSPVELNEQLTELERELRRY